jgi:urease accessory protein
VRSRSVRKMLRVLATMLMVPATAHAHLASTGLGPFYDGATHFAISPDEFIPALALALLAGLRGSRTGRLALFVLPASWFLGGLVGLAMPKSGQSMALTCVSFLILVALVALDARLRPSAVTALAVVLGTTTGYVNGSGMSEAMLGALGLAGCVTVLFILVALAAALVVSLRVPWTRIVVRVAGSWIAAAGLLLLGWAFHAEHPRLRSEAPTSHSQFAANAPPESSAWKWALQANNNLSSDSKVRRSYGHEKDKLSFDTGADNDWH